MKKQLIGTIVSDKMAKTAVVEVKKIKEHPKYRRRFWSAKKYKAHDEKGEYQTGDRVIIEECRPLSRDKRWIIKSKVKDSKIKINLSEVPSEIKTF